MWRRNWWRVTFRGMSLEGFRSVIGLQRGYGKLQIIPYHEPGWLLVFVPRAAETGEGWYLMGEKSGEPRVFKRLDTVVRVAQSLPSIGGVYVAWLRRAADQHQVSMELFRERYPLKALRRV